MRRFRIFLHRLEKAFDRNIGWFFTNGNKQVDRAERIKKEIENEKKL